VLKRKNILVLLVCAACLSSCKTVEVVAPQDLSSDIEKIKVAMSNSAIMKKLYVQEPFVQLQAEVMDGKVSREECIYRIKKIFSEYNIAHLNIEEIYDETSVNRNFKYTPFRFNCFGNDYHVVVADLKYSKYLGWKLTGIGDLSIEEVVDRVAEYYSTETSTGRKYCLENLFKVEQYYYYGLTEKNKIRFTLESEDGITEVVNFKPSLLSIYIPIKLKVNTATPFSYSYLIDSNYAMRAAPEIKTMYIQYNAFLDDHEYSVNELFNDIVKELKINTYRTIVFDIRSNGGGSANNVRQVINYLYANREELEKYNIAIVATGRTYSASCWFIDDVLRIFPDVKLFGEETGQAVFNYTCVQYSKKLKNLYCNFIYPRLADDLPELEKRSKDIHRGTIPDIEVMEGFEGSINGEDTIYKTIYDYFCKKNK
jgi:hypothetical protein